MKTLATISMALVFGTLTLAASNASAKEHLVEQQPPPQFRLLRFRLHHKPCDPCQGNGKCGGGGVVVSEPVSPPKTPVPSDHRPLPGDHDFRPARPDQEAGWLDRPLRRTDDLAIRRPEGEAPGRVRRPAQLDRQRPRRGRQGNSRRGRNDRGDVGQGISAAGSALGSAASSVAGLFGL